MLMLGFHSISRIGMNLQEEMSADMLQRRWMIDIMRLARGTLIIKAFVATT
jgi:hypothetical protein